MCHIGYIDGVGIIHQTAVEDELVVVGKKVAISDRRRQFGSVGRAYQGRNIGKDLGLLEGLREVDVVDLILVSGPKVWIM